MISDTMTERWRPTLLVYDPLKAGSIDGTDDVAHDRAILRAMKAKYKPNKEVRSDPECTIFVARLSKNTIESDLQNFFKKFGEIIAAHLVRDVVTGFSRCYAFIEYAEKRDARDAQRANGASIDEKQILVEMECGRTLKNWIPRRLGGGFSGRKESGQLRFGGNQRPFRRPYSFTLQSKRILKEEFGTPISDRPPPPRQEPRPDNIPQPAPFSGGPSRQYQHRDQNSFRGRRDDYRPGPQSRDRFSQSRIDRMTRSVPRVVPDPPTRPPERYHPDPKALERQSQSQSRERSMDPRQSRERSSDPRQSRERSSDPRQSRDRSLHRDEQARRSQSRDHAEFSREKSRESRYESESGRDRGRDSRSSRDSESRHDSRGADSWENEERRISRSRDHEESRSRERSHSRDVSKHREHRR